MNPVRLKSFDNGWYRPGRSRCWQLGWYFLGLPLLRCAIVPFSSLRVSLLRLFGARIGSGVVIKPGVRVKYPWHLEVGSHSWIGEDCWIDNLAPVRLGSNVCISQGVYFCTGNHDWTDSTFGLIVRPIAVHDGAWVGAKAILTPGAVMGECAVAAAGSVVMLDILPYEIHAGNPAAFVKRRLISQSPSGNEDTLQDRVAS